MNVFALKIKRQEINLKCKIELDNFYIDNFCRLTHFSLKLLNNSGNEHWGFDWCSLKMSFLLG